MILQEKNYYSFIKKQKIEDSYEVDYNRYLQRNNYILSVFSSFEQNKYFNPIKNGSVFCEKIKPHVWYNKKGYHFIMMTITCLYEGGKKGIKSNRFFKMIKLSSPNLRKRRASISKRMYHIKIGCPAQENIQKNLKN